MFNWIFCVSQPSSRFPPLLPEKVTRSRNTAEALQLALNYLLSGGGLITRSAMHKSPISCATYAHARSLMAVKTVINQSTWIRFPFRPSVTLLVGPHLFLLVCVCLSVCLWVRGASSHEPPNTVFVCTQLYPGAILEVCGWKLGRFPQVQGEFSCSMRFVHFPSWPFTSAPCTIWLIQCMVMLEEPQPPHCGGPRLMLSRCHMAVYLFSPAVTRLHCG